MVDVWDRYRSTMILWALVYLLVGKNHSNDQTDVMYCQWPMFLSPHESRIELKHESFHKINNDLHRSLQEHCLLMTMLMGNYYCPCSILCNPFHLLFDDDCSSMLVIVRY
jgi:hypothetical protein